MAHHKSAKKRVRQSKRRRLHNKQYKQNMKKAIKAVEEAKTYDEATEKFRDAQRILDKVSTRGVIHRNKAANKKSKLSKLVNSLKDREN